MASPAGVSADGASKSSENNYITAMQKNQILEQNEMKLGHYN